MTDAPRITDEHIDGLLQQAQFAHFPGTTVTVCVLVLKNGFTAVGHSACVSPENFCAQTGKDIAFRNAREQVWQLEGYLLRETLHREEQVDAAADEFAQAAQDLEYALSRQIA